MPRRIHSETGSPAIEISRSRGLIPAARVAASISLTT
jgi:hypothetical protein